MIVEHDATVFQSEGIRNNSRRGHESSESLRRTQPSNRMHLTTKWPYAPFRTNWGAPFRLKESVHQLSACLNRVKTDRETDRHLSAGFLRFTSRAGPAISLHDFTTDFTTRGQIGGLNQTSG
jgi:hypothetical protein